MTVFPVAYTNCRKTVEMKLFVKNVMIPNKIVYKPRWEGVCFLPVSNISSPRLRLGKLS
jgi:hypothetical protein